MLYTKYEYRDGVRLKKQNRKRPWQEDVLFLLESEDKDKRNIQLALGITLRNKDNIMAEKILSAYNNLPMTQKIGEAAAISGSESCMRECIKQLGDNFRAFAYIGNNQELYEKLLIEEKKEESKIKNYEIGIGQIFGKPSKERYINDMKYAYGSVTSDQDEKVGTIYAQIAGILGEVKSIEVFLPKYKTIAITEAVLYDQISVVMDVDGYSNLKPKQTFEIFANAAMYRISPLIAKYMEEFYFLTDEICYCIALGSIKGRYTDYLSSCLLLKDLDQEYISELIKHAIEVDSVEVMDCLLSLTEKKGVGSFIKPENVSKLQKNINLAFEQGYFAKLISQYS